MKAFQLTVHFSPNIGGVETHLSDLIKVLINKNWKVFVLCYQPLTTKIDWKILEKNYNLVIFRIPWIRGFFEKLVNFPEVEFIYLVPGLFLLTPFVIFFYKPNVLHAHGLSAAFVAVFWGKLFNIRTVISLHSIYQFPKKGLYHNFVKLIFTKADHILSLSKKSNKEVKQLGIKGDKVAVFTYWIDLEKFKRIPDARKKLAWSNNFTVLFVGRLIKEKGVDILLQSARDWDQNIKLMIIGAGPLEDEVLIKCSKIKQVNFLGKVDQEKLPIYYSASDCLIIPSVSEEGFGRVIIESLACGTPVIGANIGAIPEAMDDTVGKFFEVSPRNIKKIVEDFYHNRKDLKKLSSKAREFAERRYSKFNAESIIKIYQR